MKNSILYIISFLILSTFIYISSEFIPPAPTIPNSISNETQKYPFYPDKNLTPGDAFLNVTKEDICKSGYSKSVRDVSVTTKRKVYNEYGLSYPQKTGEYEVDHFISLELGGSNDIKNLWPEAANPRPGFHEKDLVENYLHSEVCKGNMTLIEAQTQEKTDWIKVYNSIKK